MRNHWGFSMRTWVILLALLIGLTARVSAQKDCIDTVRMTTSIRYEDNAIFVDVHVENAIDLIGFQFYLNFDNEVLSFEDKELAPFPNYQAYIVGGTIRASWIDQTGCCNPLNLPDGYKVMTIKFRRKKLFNESYLYITSEEFATSDLKLYCVEKTTSLVLSSPVILKGKVIFDENENCGLDTGENAISGVLLEISNGTQLIYRFSDEDGAYAVGLTPGIYKVKVLPKYNLWKACVSEFVMTLENNKTTETNFFLQPTISCSYLATTISAPPIRGCSENQYTLKYQNLGNIGADLVSLNLAYDRSLKFISTDFSGNYTVTSDSIVFNLGNVLPSQGGTIHAVFYAECDAAIDAQIHCVSSTIYPHQPCIVDPRWSSALVKITSECIDNSKTVFKIENIGTKPMPDPLDYIVTEDDILRPGGVINLKEDEATNLEFDGNGSTYSVRSKQVSFSPYQSMPSSTIEGCGTNSSNSFSTGYFTLFEYDDRDAFVDIDCQESIVSNVPNLISAYPKGYGSKHFIENDTKLEYNFTFRNTSQSTHNYIVLKNSISPFLDITTLEMDAASHPYSYRITDERDLVVSFENIALKDSIHDPMRSIGFIKYSIYPHKNLPLGTVIESSGRVNFDFIYEKTLEKTFHTIGTDFIINVENIDDFTQNIVCYPNPTSALIVIAKNSLIKNNLEFAMFSMDGINVRSGIIRDQNFTLDCSLFPKGTYMIYFHDESKLISTKKIIIK